MASGYLPGKFGRFQAGTQGGQSPASVTGAYRWAPGFKRERLDTTNFESAVSPSGNNVFSEGDTGVLDTTFSVEMWMSAVNVNFFFPDATLVCNLYYRKNIPLGYVGLIADVLDFSPNVAVREMSKATAQLQTNGLVAVAA